MKKRILFALVLGFSFGSKAFCGAVEAGNIAAVSQKANSLVQRVLARSNGAPSLSPEVGGLSGLEGTGLEDILENDALALPAFMQSASHLSQAANYAFQSQAAYLGGNIAFGNFKFATACARLSIGKLALSRANFAAIQPPVGFFGVFNAEIIAVLQEIFLAQSSNGCP